MFTYSHPRSTISLLCISYLCAGMASAADTLVFGDPVVLPDTRWPLSFATTDVNGDGLVDLIAARASSSPVVLLNNGTGNPFENVAGLPLSESDHEASVDVADVNGDARPDVITTGRGAPLVLYLNNGTSNSFANVTGFYVFSPADHVTADLAFADLNDDGLLDLGFASGNERRSRVILNDGSAIPFSGYAALDIGSGAETGPAHDIALADLNDDDLPDAILTFSVGARKPIEVYLNNGTQNPFGGVAAQFVDGARAFDLEVADVNGDDRPDLVVIKEDENVIYFHTGSSTEPYATARSLPPSNLERTCASMAVFDINDDAALDLLFGCADPLAWPDVSTAGVVYMNNGSADPFAEVMPIELPSIKVDHTLSLLVADFEGNGELTLLIAALDALYVPLSFVSHPLAADDAFLVGTGGFLNVDVLENDRSGGSIDRSSLAITLAPLRGTASIDPDSQTILYRPEADFLGEDTLQYTVRDTDGAVSNLATVSFDVQGQVLVREDAGVIPVNVPMVLIDVLANDESLFGKLDPSTLEIVQAPVSGTARVVPETFVIEYRRTTTIPGTDTLTYTVRNDLGAISDPAMVTITIAPPVFAHPPSSPSTRQHDRSSGGGGSMNMLALIAFWSLAFAVHATARRTRSRRGMARFIGHSVTNHLIPDDSPSV